MAELGKTLVEWLAGYESNAGFRFADDSVPAERLNNVISSAAWGLILPMLMSERWKDAPDKEARHVQRMEHWLSLAPLEQGIDEISRERIADEETAAKRLERISRERRNRIATDLSIGPSLEPPAVATSESFEYFHTWVSAASVERHRDAATLGMSHVTETSIYPTREIQDALNEFGRRGWQLVSMEAHWYYEQVTHARSLAITQAAVAVPLAIQGWYCTFSRKIQE